MKDWQRKSMAARIRNQIKDIEETFKKFDTDGSGMISHAEFITALRSMGVRGVGDADSWQMMQRFRKPGNHSGTMSYEEFRDCMVRIIPAASCWRFRVVLLYAQSWVWWICHPSAPYF